MIHWVREAAERGDAEAAMKLGESYMKGEGVEKNEEEAQTWFRRAEELQSKDKAATETPSAQASAPDPIPAVTDRSPTSGSVVVPKTMPTKKSGQLKLRRVTASAKIQRPTSVPGVIPQTMPTRESGRRKLRGVAAVMGLALVLGGGIGAYYMLREDPYVAYQRLTKEGKEHEAMERLHVAAEGGNVSAQADLGLCYANGRGVSGDMSIPAAVAEAICVSDRAHVDYISTPVGARRAAHAVAQGILTCLKTR